MKFYGTILLAGIMILAGFSMAWAGGMRCGNNIVNVNDSAFIIEQKCGSPISRSHVGYVINEEKKRELLIEEWVFGPKNEYFYLVTITGGRVSGIRSEKK
ncbi:MAG: DUF2845 domain-containing protein [Desulfobacteraceae bacterium]|nr:DUF2845 domain-containing protein [Desulfobacteraceae bacterium]